VVPAATEAHAFVQQRLGDGPLPETDLVHFVPIADPKRQALASFHDALRNLETSDNPEAKVRVAFYGASSVAADRYTAYLRGYLQKRFGDAGVGFVSLVPLWRWHRHNAITLKASKHWVTEHAQKENERLDGDYGIKGASTYTTHKRAKSQMRAKASAFSDPNATELMELYFLAQPGGGSFKVKPGKNDWVTISTAADARGPGYQTLAFEGSPLPLKLEVEGDGEVRLFGATMERKAKGVIVDELGIGGTRAANHNDWTESIWRDNILRRKPALVVLAYGANEAVDEDEPIEVYRDALTKMVQRLRATLPEASCVLVGPQDFPVQNEETEAWEVRPRMNQIVEIQREVSAKQGCGFFDLREMMGGVGSMDSWVAADPQLAKDDHLHMTPLGYLYLGRTLTDALMADYDAGH
jgi:lysophospholipase L1-like esterase